MVCAFVGGNIVSMKIVTYVLALVLLVCVNTNTSFALDESAHVDIRGLNTYWVNGLNNNIRVINFNGNIKYFKECKMKLDETSEIKRIIENYFGEYLNNKFLFDKDLLTQAILDNENKEKFLNAGFLWDKNSNLSKYIRNDIDSSPLGISNDVAKKLTVDLKDFLLYSSRELVHRHISSNIVEGELQTNLAVKQIATYKLAKLFGIDFLVVKSKFIKLITDYGEKFGVLTDKATGINSETINTPDLTIDPKFQRDLTSLQILDTITNEQDHSPFNCSFQIKNGKLISITAFDNEGSFGLDTNLHKGGLCWNAVSPLLTENNSINLPHVNKVLAEKLLAIKSNDIVKILKDLLSDAQIDSCVKRFESLKSALANTISQDNNYLLDDENWSRNTILQEISGNYGNTYLTHYLKKLNISVK